MNIIQTAERVSSNPSDNFVFQRSLLAYQTAAKMVSGNVLEIGTGSGYGIAEIAPKTKEFWTLDKHDTSIDYSRYTNTRFIKNKVPPLTNIPDSYFDFVICFQVIEHIKDCDIMLKEIHRVLKSNGKLIISTPNRKMSLTRNPWHIKEYSGDEFSTLLSKNFQQIEKKGVSGNENITMYYNNNKSSVEKILKFDIFNLTQRLPRWLLTYPYDLMNRANRVFLMKTNTNLSTSITANDYSVQDFSEDCYDLFFIAKK